MSVQFRRLDFHQIGFHMLDNSIAHFRRQKIDNRTVNVGRRRERPRFHAVAVHDLHDLIGQLFVNAALGLGFQFTFAE